MNIPCQVARPDQEKERKTIVEANKAKEENLKVAGKRCWRKNFLQTLKITGEIFIGFLLKFRLATVSTVIISKKCFFSSETLVLPVAVLLAIVAYAVVAIIFYNNYD